GYLVYGDLAKQIRHDKQEDLAAITTLKARQVAEWVAERRAGGEYLLHALVFTTELERWMAAGRPEGEFKALLRRRLGDFVRVSRYRSGWVVDEQGEALAGTVSPRDAPPQARALALAALEKNAVLFSDVRWEGAEEKSALGIDVVVPLSIETPQGRKKLGAVIFEIDPGEFLFPLIQSWPTASASAETFLVRVEGREMVYVNELRHRSGTALKLRFPLEKWDLAGALLLRRGNGTVEGVDYRDVPVLAAGRKVAGTDWTLVSKIDQAEIYASLQSLAAWFSAVIALFVAGAGAAVWLWWRGQQAAFAATRYRLELERGGLKDRLGFLPKHANDIIMLLDERTRILEVNDRALEAYGYSREELLGMSSKELRTPDAALAYERDVELVGRRGGHVYETVHRRKDGTTFPVEISGRFIDVDGKRLRQNIIRDISERKAAENRLRDLNRSLQMLSNCNEILVRAKNEDELLAKICNTIVEVGG
ncbi:MAG: PAS domain S-box protein, partial [Chloroflexota bacterium]